MDRRATSPTWGLQPPCKQRWYEQAFTAPTERVISPSWGPPPPRKRALDINCYRLSYSWLLQLILDFKYNN